MFAVEIYAAVRRFVFVEGKSRREAARVFGLSRDTISKMCRYSAPPGYVRSKAPERPKLGPLVPVIDAILEADKTAPAKQRHTAKRIFERLRLEHGYAGGYTVVKDYVRTARTGSREVFVPLSHPPGHAQVDFGECVGIIGGVRMKLHVFCFDLPQSDACFIKAYPAETTEAFLDGHISAFAFFGGVPISILYDNLKIAVARILGDGKRQRTRAFTELVSHYLFQDRFGRPGKGNDKGKVEALAARRTGVFGGVTGARMRPRSADGCLITSLSTLRAVTSLSRGVLLRFDGVELALIGWCSWRTSASCSTPWSQCSTHPGRCRARAAEIGGNPAPI